MGGQLKKLQDSWETINILELIDEVLYKHKDIFSEELYKRTDSLFKEIAGYWYENK